jgi:hypothetical protein
MWAENTTSRRNGTEGQVKEMCPQYIGPYEVLEVDGVNVVIKRGRSAQKVHVNRKRPFY